MNAQTPQKIFAKDYRPVDHTVTNVDLTFDLASEATVVTAVLSMMRQGAADSPLVLLGSEPELLSFAIDGKEIDLSHLVREDETLTLSASHLPTSNEYIVTIRTRINPKANTALEGLYQSSAMYCTQCEAEGFRKITYFPDRPDVMAVYRTRIEADKTECPVMLSNGNCVEKGDIDGNRHYAVWEDPFPKPSYLFALVAGNLARIEDHFTTKSGRTVTLQIFVEHGNEDRCDWAMECLKASMKWDEERYGLEYDLDIFMIVAVSDFNMGAMENKGLNVFNSKYVLARPDTATDMDYALIEGIIAHEYFHNWSGNRVTCRDWFQLSLKEGLTVFRDQEFSADMRSAPVQRIGDVRALRARQFPEDSGPLAHPVRPDSFVEINNFYTATVYEKGAEVVRMIQTLVGKSGFRKGLDLYFDRHDGQAVTVEDFVKAMEDANSIDLGQFRNWYSQAGTPILSFDSSYDAATKKLNLSLNQHCNPTPDQPSKPEFHIPVSLALLSDKGEELPLSLESDQQDLQMIEGKAILSLKAKKKTYTFTNVAEKPVLSLLRDFSAPVRLETKENQTELLARMRIESNPFNRFEAAQVTATSLILDQASAIAAGEKRAMQTVPFVDAMKATLENPDLDKAFLAQIFTMPSENDLAQHVEEIHPNAIHQARNQLRNALGHGLKEKLLEIYHGNQINEPYAPTVEQSGARSLCNRALDLLNTTDDPEMLNLVVNQFDQANNMTDSVAALAILIDKPGSQKDKALETFYDRWKSDAIVLDKWFSLQAMTQVPGALNLIKRLVDHPDFSNRNPNRFRSVISVLSISNPVTFHNISGDGYRFIADQIIGVDKLNPQVAARTANAFGQWKRYDRDRRDLMRHELERIKNTEGLSRDTLEMVNRMLEG